MKTFIVTDKQATEIQRAIRYTLYVREERIERLHNEEIRQEEMERFERLSHATNLINDQITEQENDHE